MTQVNLISMTTVTRQKKHHSKQSILHCNEHLVKKKKTPRISNGGNQPPPYYAGFLTHNKIEDAVKIRNIMIFTGRMNMK